MCADNAPLLDALLMTDAAKLQVGKRREADRQAEWWGQVDMRAECQGEAWEEEPLQKLLQQAGSYGASANQAG